MKKSTWIMLACALIVSMLGAPAAFACTSTTTETVSETSPGGITGSDCWYAGGSGMMTYNLRETITNINEYEITTNYCTGYTERRFVRTVYSYVSSSCWQLTSSSCVGPQDWYPSPRC